MPRIASLLSKQADLDTMMGRVKWTSVKINGVFIPAVSLRTHLSSFGRNLVLFTHDAKFETQLIGSATGINYRGHNFLIATAHQTKERNLQDIGMLVPERNTLLTSAGITRTETSQSKHESDAHDLVAFDFTPQSIEIAEINQIFFEMNVNTILSDQETVSKFLAFGFPFEDQKYHIVEDNTVGTVIRSLICEPSVQPSDMALGQCRTLESMTFDPNGISGGPVFAVIGQGADVIVKFAGVINRAGCGLIHYIKARIVAQLLDATIDHF